MTDHPDGRIKVTPEDFVVDEVPAYLPSGEGEHLYLHFTKTNLTTEAAVRTIAGALGVRPHECGVAGLKDKVGVTSQWVSVHAPDRALDARAQTLALDGIVIDLVRRHTNKLKTGHLAGNRFTIVVRDVPAARAAAAVATLERIGREGLPNAFGEQRFGREGDNAERARRWLAGEEPGPRDPRRKRFLWSALQSAVFNAVLEARVADGTWSTPLEGDILKTAHGGLFVCTDVQTDRERALRGEVSPTGPMVGVKMRTPSGRPAELERAVTARILGEGFDLTRTRPLGEGTRRSLRLFVEGMRAAVELDKSPDTSPDTCVDKRPTGRDVNAEEGVRIRVQFVLPKGAYATTVLGTAFQLRQPTNQTTAQAPEEAEAPGGEPDDS